MAKMNPRIHHIRFKHSNWGEKTPICLIEPHKEPFEHYDYDPDYYSMTKDEVIQARMENWWANGHPYWALNLIVGLNGSGKTTLLKCIDWACNENRPLSGKNLDSFNQKLRSHGVDFFEIAVSFETQFSHHISSIGPVILDMYKAELMQRFINLGHIGDDDEFYDWFFDEIVEEFTNGVQEMLTLNFVTKFDIKNNNTQLEIIPEIYRPGFKGFKVENGKLIKTEIDLEFHDTIRLPSINLSNQAIYPSIEPGDLLARIKNELHNIGLEFEFEDEQYPPNYPRTHRIKSKAAFVVEEAFNQGLEALEDKNRLKEVLSDLSGFEVSKKFNIKKNDLPMVDWSQPKNESTGELGLVHKKNSVYCFHAGDRLDIQYPTRGPWRTTLEKDVTEPWIFDEETGTQFSTPMGGYMFNPREDQLIRFIKHRLLDIKNSEAFVAEKLFDIPREIIASLQAVKRLSPSYKFGGYLTDGQARLASLVHDILTEPYEILLIDEPETSMHIDWQRRIVSEIITESQFRNSMDGDVEPEFSQIYITTHSPDVILEHLDMVTELISKNEGVHLP